MFFPPNAVPEKKSFIPIKEVYLEDGHICIKRSLAEKIFRTEMVVFTIFYAKDKTFLAAPASEESFKNIHKVQQQMLKSKNLSGDKSISIQEILLDNDIAENDRDLTFLAEEALHILKVHL
ncbi:hypothetical protein ACDQ55_16365 [Chitinophaga sp. 30R24]|uniref:hypothetical protein n=1 Tax=Chitinophaga sp. 30R24 TaxID=3248838 RepID=UPI003B8EB458